MGIAYALGANLGEIIWLIFGNEIYVFLIMSFFYYFFTSPVLKIIPKDDIIISEDLIRLRY